ncbi:hypothetical protein H0H93_007438, partial [Arthromyces matolae]
MKLQWFRPEVEERRQRDRKLYMHLLNDVRERMQKGNLPECLSSQVAFEQEQIGMTDEELAYALSSTFGAGIEI